MNYLFWILFISESLFLSWMFWDEMKLEYLPIPSYIPIGFLWLVGTILVKLVLKSDKVAMLMVGIPGIPLVLMAGLYLFVMIIEFVSGPIRWN